MTREKFMEDKKKALKKCACDYVSGAMRCIFKGEYFKLYFLRDQFKLQLGFIQSQPFPEPENEEREIFNEYCNMRNITDVLKYRNSKDICTAIRSISYTTYNTGVVNNKKDCVWFWDKRGGNQE